MLQRVAARVSLPKVAVIILNYNGLKWLPRCLSSLVKTEYPYFEIYLVDNASSDASVDFVRHSIPSVKIIRNPRNLGFAAAYNQSIGAIEAEYVVLLNNDTEILNPHWLTSLVDVVNERTDVAAVAAKMVSMENHRVLDSVGSMGVPYWSEGFAEIGKGELDEGQYSESLEPFAFCGGAALLRRSAFVDVGGFDEALFLYYEDPDLSWRLRLRGWKIRFAPDATIAHYRGGSLGGGEVTALMLYYIRRNLLRAILKNCGSSLPWALKNYFLFSFSMVPFLLMREPDKAIAFVKGIAWNLRKLRSSCGARRVVQIRRTVYEKEILRAMYPDSFLKQRRAQSRGLWILGLLLKWGSR